MESDEFTSSILRHEGRHAIDLASKKKYDTWELEYRAKLSEIALAPAPRQALASVVDNDIGGDGTHARANGRLATELAAWMGAHRAEIRGFDAALPPLPQIDRLTDDQIRMAVQGLDPLASTPTTAESTDAANTAIFAAAKADGFGKASPAMNSDMVKPIPARAPAPRVAFGIGVVRAGRAYYTARALPTAAAVT